MDKILEINGIQYIQKAEYDKAQKDLQNVKTIVSTSIANLTGFLNNTPVTQAADDTVTKETKEVTNKPGRKPSRRHYSLRNEDLIIYSGETRLYSGLYMDEDGFLYGGGNGRRLKFTIRQVITINKEYSSATTHKDISRWAKNFKLSVNVLYRIIYNIDKGVFVDLIKEYLSSANNIQIKQKPVEEQNNPQKRKEAGIYS